MYFYKDSKEKTLMWFYKDFQEKNSMWFYKDLKEKQNNVIFISTPKRKI